MNKMINEIKEIHAKDVCLFKVGSFYHAYGRDACIMSYLFNYIINVLGTPTKFIMPNNNIYILKNY